MAGGKGSRQLKGVGTVHINHRRRLHRGLYRQVDGSADQDHAGRAKGKLLIPWIVFIPGIPIEVMLLYIIQEGEVGRVLMFHVMLEKHGQFQQLLKGRLRNQYDGEEEYGCNAAHRANLAQ